MKCTDRMEVKGICVGVSLKEKDGVIEILAALQQKCGSVEQARALARDIFYKEEQESAAIGAGVAILHLRSDAVKQPCITAVTAPQGVDFDAPDGEKSRLIFLVALPAQGGEDPYSRLKVLLMNEQLRETLIAAEDEVSFLSAMCLGEEDAKGTRRTENVGTSLILAVAAEDTEELAQLREAAERLGIALKCELPGAPFTDREIAAAQGVLLLGGALCSDCFDGKPVLEAPLQDAAYRPEHLLRAVPQATVFHKQAEPKRLRRRLPTAYFRSRLPLLPVLILAGGLLLLGGAAASSLSAAGVGAFLQETGSAAYRLILPLICGFTAFRYARWQGLALGLCAGVLLVQGGVWLAVLGGLCAGLLARAFGILWEQTKGALRILTALLPAVGLAALGVLALLTEWLAAWIEQGLRVFLNAVGTGWAGQAVLGALAALDPAGPLHGAAQRCAAETGAEAVTAGGLALALGITAFSLIFYKKLDPVRRRMGWCAMPGALCGALGGYLPFAAADPFRVLLFAMVGGAAAGGLTAVFGGESPLFLCGALIGGLITCGLLCWAASFHGENSAHKV